MKFPETLKILAIAVGAVVATDTLRAISHSPQTEPSVVVEADLRREGASRSVVSSRWEERLAALETRGSEAPAPRELGDAELEALAERVVGALSQRATRAAERKKPAAKSDDE